jgi:hypothetical protein
LTIVGTTLAILPNTYIYFEEKVLVEKSKDEWFILIEHVFFHQTWKTCSSELTP